MAQHFTTLDLLCACSFFAGFLNNEKGAKGRRKPGRFSGAVPPKGNGLGTVPINPESYTIHPNSKRPQPPQGSPMDEFMVSALHLVGRRRMIYACIMLLHPCETQ